MQTGYWKLGIFTNTISNTNIFGFANFQYTQQNIRNEGSSLTTMTSDEEIKTCPLCEREMPDGTYNAHHLVPATFKGTELIELHYICHSKIHHTFTERELQHYYHTIDRLLENEDIQKFVKWVGKKDPDFNDKNKDTKNRKRKRKR